MLGVLALVVRLPLLFDRYSADGVPDAQGYLAIADDILHGRGFGGLVRTPGYPLFIALLDLLPGRSEDAVIVVQHLLGVGLVVMIVLATWRFFGRAAAVLAGFLAAIAPPLIAVEHDVLTDFLFALLVFGGTVVMAGSASRAPVPVGRLAAVGLLFGFATQVRPTGQVLVLVAPVVFALATASLRATARATLVVTVAMAVVVAPWVIRNEITRGAPVLSIIGQEALYWRVFDQDHLPVVTDGPDAEAVKQVIARSRAVPGNITNTVLPVTAALKRRGHTDAETAGIEARLAVDAIRANPRPYIKGSVRNLKELALMAHAPTVKTSTLTLAFYRRRAEATRATAFRLPIAGPASAAWNAGPWVMGAWLVLALVSPLALLLSGLRSPAGVALVTFGWAWLLIEAASALTAIPTPRFAAQALPLLWVAGSAGSIIVLRSLWAAIRSRWGKCRRRTASA